MKFKAARKKTREKPAFEILPILSGALFVVLPFVVSFSGYDKFRLPKDVFVVLGILGLAAVFLAGGKVVFPKRMDTWNGFLLAGFVYLTIHVILIRPSEMSVSGLAVILYFLLLLGLVSQVASREFQRKVWSGIGIATSLNAILTILQVSGKAPLMIRPGGGDLNGRLVPAGFIGDVNSGAVLFALVVVVSLYWVFAETSWRFRILAGSILVLNLLGLAFTQTLTAIFALGVSFLIWLVFHHWWVWRTKGKLTRELVIFWVVLLLGSAAGVAAAQQAGVLNRVQVVARQLSRGDLSTATAGRQPVYVITWQMIKEDPVFGKGLNSFGKDFYFARADTVSGQRAKLVNQPGAFRQVHNEYLQVWEELGILGLLAFLGVLLIPIAYAVRIIRQEEDPRQIYWMGLQVIGLILVALTCLTFFPFHLTVTGALVVLLAGSIRAESKRGLEDGKSLGELLPSFWGKQWVRIVVILLLVAPLVYGQIGKWRANRDVAVAAFLLERARSPEFNERRRRVFADEAWDRLDRAEQLAPRLYEIYSLQGTAKLLLGQRDEAKELYRKAASVLPSPELFTNLATAHLAAGEKAEARKYLESALRYNPDYEAAKMGLELLKKERR